VAGGENQRETDAEWCRAKGKENDNGQKLDKGSGREGPKLGNSVSKIMGTKCCEFSAGGKRSGGENEPALKLTGVVLN